MQEEENNIKRGRQNQKKCNFTIKHKHQIDVMHKIDNAILDNIPFNLTYKDGLYILSVTCSKNGLNCIMSGNPCDYFFVKNEPNTFGYMDDYPEAFEGCNCAMDDDYNSHCSILEGGFDDPTADEWDSIL